MMTLEENRAEFVRRVWEYVVPLSETQPYFNASWVPAKILDQRGGRVRRQDLQTIDLKEIKICTICFAHIHRSLSRDWSSLPPELKVRFADWLSELNLWKGFDRTRIKTSAEERDITRVRFDIADAVFNFKQNETNRKLEELGFDLQQRTIAGGKDTETTIIIIVRNLVIMRAHIDLAMLVVQNIIRHTLVIERITARFQNAWTDRRRVLEDALINSTFWHGLVGETYVFGKDIPDPYRDEARNKVAPRLAVFHDILQQFEQRIMREVPPMQIINECAEIMRGSIMSTQNVTTNVHVTNSQIGILNTGTLRDVQSIDASITTLKTRGDLDVGHAFSKLAEGVVGDDSLAEVDKAELLSNLKYLSETAAKNEEERAPSVLRSVLRSVADGINAAGPALKTLAPLISVITKFFGL
jgi:hypothetical protein